ncbi:3229_t:CDS:2, partial [Ambispora leptoticha]
KDLVKQNDAEDHLVNGPWWLDPLYTPTLRQVDEHNNLKDTYLCNSVWWKEMDSTKYGYMKTFLETARHPSQFNSRQKKSLESQSKFFVVYNQLLYKRDRRKSKKPQLLRVIKQEELTPLLYLMHDHPLDFPLSAPLEEKEIDRVNVLVNDLPVNRAIAKENINESQQRQKFRWDKKLKKVVRTFNMGDKVLLFDAAQLGRHTGKLSPKWLGPYIVHARVAQDVYKLRTLENQILEAPRNAFILKRYYERI